jgi:dTDP-4-dehydrorhamnose reductase
MANILISGSYGQLGQALLAAASEFPAHKLWGYDLDQMDICQIETVKDKLQKHRADVLINCAAYTAVDAAEEHREAAQALNVQAVGALTELCRSTGLLFVHISTDYVFDGQSHQPYTENDVSNPLSVYGASKRAGELLALAYPRSLVIRTSWLYAPGGKNFVNTMLRLGHERPSIKVVNDQRGVPTYAPDLARAILQNIEHDGKILEAARCGLYHYCNHGQCSWYEFACKIKEYTGFPADVHPIASADYPATAPRPSYSVLSTQKMQKAFGLQIPPWEDGLRRMLQAQTPSSV